MNSWEDRDEAADRMRMNKILRREEYLSIVMTLVEVMLRTGDKNPHDRAKELAKDIQSNVEDLHPLPSD
jgi:hypothetical protein